ALFYLFLDAKKALSLKGTRLRFAVPPLFGFTETKSTLDYITVYTGTFFITLNVTPKVNSGSEPSSGRLDKCLQPRAFALLTNQVQITFFRHRFYLPYYFASYSVYPTGA